MLMHFPDVKPNTKRAIESCISTCILLASLVLTVSNVSAEEYTIEQIQESWQKRCNAINALHLKYDSVRIEPPPARGWAPQLIPEGLSGPQPHQLNTELWLSGEKIDVVYKRDPKQVPWLPAMDRYVHNELGCQAVVKDAITPNSGSGWGGFATGQKSKGDFGMYAVLRPIFLLYRHREVGPLSFNFDEAKLLPGITKVGETSCVVLQTEREFQGLRTAELMLDPERDFIPVQMIDRTNERPVCKFDCTYEPDPTVGYAITDWTMTIVNAGGEVSTTETTQVTLFEANPVVPDEQFQIQYPEGARIHLQDNNKMVYVQADGIIPGYTGPDVTDSGGISPRLIAAAIACAFLIIVVIWLRTKAQR